VAETAPDAIVLHHIPNEDLPELVDALRKTTTADLIIIPTVFSEDDLIYYLGKGVTDYVGRPLTPRALSARIHALYQHRAGNEAPGAEGEDIELDPTNRTVRVVNDVIPLTPVEYKLFQALLLRRGRACSSKSLLEQVWGPDSTDRDHYLRIYIGLLRRKIEADPHNPRLILTVWGSGYRLAESGPTRLKATRRQRSRQTEGNA